MGSVTRVAAPDVEVLVLQALQQRKSGNNLEAGPEHVIPTHHDQDNEATLSDHDLVHRSVVRITIHKTRIDIALKKTAEQQQDADLPDQDLGSVEDNIPGQLSMPFASNHPLRKGVAHESSSAHMIDAKTRESLLLAIGRARVWMESTISGSKARSMR